MNFNDAARAASFDVRKEYAPLLGTYGVVISESSAKKVTEIITKHFQPLSDLNAKLVELARKMQEVSNNRGAINLCKTVGMAINPEWVDKANAAETSIVEILTDPTVAAAIRDGDKGEVG